MRSLLSAVVILFSGLSFVSSSVPFTRGSGADSLFGISRGGGLFGKDNDSEQAEVSTGGQKYPAMTQDEVKDFLEHIPVFAVTDSQGSGVVLKPDGESSVFYFFMSPVQANATLQQLKGQNEDMDLKVSAFSLGRIWFDLLHAAPDKEITLKTPGSDDATPTTGVEYRLVPDTRDLLGARMLLTMTPEDGEKMREGMTAEVAQEALQKAMGETPKFNSTFNEIPVFTIAQMRMQKKQEEGESGEPITLLPMYFSLQNMVSTWQQFMQAAPEEVQGVEPAINLISLHEMVEMMQKDSEVDWRNIVLVPSAPVGGEDGGPTASVQPAAEDMAKMGGATLGDL